MSSQFPSPHFTYYSFRLSSCNQTVPCSNSLLTKSHTITQQLHTVSELFICLPLDRVIVLPYFSLYLSPPTRSSYSSLPDCQSKIPEIQPGSIAALWRGFTWGFWPEIIAKGEDKYCVCLCCKAQAGNYRVEIAVDGIWHFANLTLILQGFLDTTYTTPSYYILLLYKSGMAMFWRAFMYITLSLSLLPLLLSLHSFNLSIPKSHPRNPFKP